MSTPIIIGEEYWFTSQRGQYEGFGRLAETDHSTDMLILKIRPYYVIDCETKKHVPFNPDSNLIWTNADKITLKTI